MATQKKSTKIAIKAKAKPKVKEPIPVEFEETKPIPPSPPTVEETVQADVTQLLISNSVVQSQATVAISRNIEMLTTVLNYGVGLYIQQSKLYYENQQLRQQIQNLGQQYNTVLQSYQNLYNQVNERK